MKKTRCARARVWVYRGLAWGGVVAAFVLLVLLVVQREGGSCTFTSLDVCSTTTTNGTLR